MSQNDWLQLVGPANLATNAVLLNVLLVILILWSLTWKGIALWKAAQSNAKVWFIVLLLVNTVGILEILYIFVFSKMRKTDDKSL